MNSFRDMIRRRRSCRAYTDELLSEEAIRDLLNQAVWVPSGSNNQPWRFVVITDKALMERYSDAAKRDWLRKLDESPHMQQYEEFIKDPDYNIFYHAPALIIIYGNTDSFWYVYDCSMVAYNLHLLAEESGLGACWIGFAHNIFSAEETKSELGIPGGYELVAPVIIGHPAKSGVVPEVSRKPFVTNFFNGGK
jgi:nitroreductase